MNAKQNKQYRHDCVTKYNVIVTKNMQCSKNYLERLSIPASLKHSDTIFDTGNSTVSVSTTDKPNDATITNTHNIMNTISVNIKLN